MLAEYRTDFITWGMRLGFLAFLGLLITAGPAHAQTVDPATVAQSILTWLTGPFAKLVIAILIACVGVACIIGHHPLAGICLIVLGGFMIFSSQFFVTTFWGG